MYFDHQATTPVSQQVLLKMQPYFQESYANPHSVDHVEGWNSLHAVENAAQQVGKFIGADHDEIIFTSGATESNNLALQGLVKCAFSRQSKKKKIILSSIEHKSVLEIGRILKEHFKFQVEKLPVDTNGFVSLSSLENALADDVLVVSIMAVNNEIGTVQEITRISEIVRKSGAIFHCDAAQAPIAIEMQEFAKSTDLLSLSGHKMYAPKGIGVLYVRRELQDDIEPIIYGGGQQNGLRSGTLPTPLCVGMGAAAEFLGSQQASAMRKKLSTRRDYFVESLSKLQWSTILNGPSTECRHPGNANLSFKGFIAHDILNVLQPHLAASTGSACSSGIFEPSHVLKAIGRTSEAAEASIRFSLGFDTRIKDIDEAVDLIDKALNKLSGISLETYHPYRK